MTKLADFKLIIVKKSMARKAGIGNLYEKNV